MSAQHPVWLLTDAATDVHAAPGHPERPSRRAAVAEGIRDAAVDRLAEPAIEPATDAQILAVHDGALLASLREADADGAAWLDPDTYVVGGSWAAAALAAGATVQAAKAVAAGEAEIAFAVVRPPGHHASARRASGFCLLNNVAIAVAALRADGLARRIAVVDWDVHHGDGTQAIFDEDADLWYASTHQWPLFPGTGLAEEMGKGPAVGTKQNRPLAPGAGDDEFVRAWLDDLLPAIEVFEPDAILVSAGYDAHRSDPLANLSVTEEGFAAVARALGALSARLRHPGVALTLEGGYDLDALRASTAATVRELLVGRGA
ncbi:MAG: histone deacetylase [Chloroflexota bacterium]|nr:histone deacetylase [Chloroflexota bacterium]